MTQQAHADFKMLRQQIKKNRQRVARKLSRLSRHTDTKLNNPAVITSAAKYYLALKKLAAE